MKSVDKFGNPIYPKTYSILVKQGKKLFESGYKESKKSPNLFYKRYPILEIDRDSGEYIIDEYMVEPPTFYVIFFADMRGTDEVKIWEDTDPLFYWKFKDRKKLPDWLKRRFINEEIRKLENSYIKVRLSYYETFLSGGDGICKVCGEDFQDEGDFCSKYCESAYDEVYKTRCARCGKEIKWNEIIRHHLSYDLNKTINVCKSCHTRIHISKKQPSKLRPLDKKGANKKKILKEPKEPMERKKKKLRLKPYLKGK